MTLLPPCLSSGRYILPRGVVVRVTYLGLVVLVFLLCFVKQTFVLVIDGLTNPLTYLKFGACTMRLYCSVAGVPCHDCLSNHGPCFADIILSAAH